MTSTASAAAYGADICHKLEQASVIGGLFTSQEWSVTECLYCCYDAFTRVDIQCHMHFPGGVSAVAIDAHGQLYVASEELWRRVAVSAFLRYEHLSPELCTLVPALVRHEAVATPDSEEELLQAVLDLYSSGLEQEDWQRLAVDSHGGARAEDDVLIGALLAHFRRRQCWDAAAEFFAQLAQLAPAAAAGAAVALRELGRDRAALETTRRALSCSDQAQSIDAPLLAAVAATEADLGSMDDALLAARLGLFLAPESRASWLGLANLLAKCGAWDLALAALNGVPPPPDSGDTFLVAFPCAFPPFVRVTAPLTPHFDPDAFEVAAGQRPAGKRTAGGATRGDLSGDAFTNAAHLETAPHRMRAHLSAAAYLLLLCAVEELGWEGFLSVRRSVLAVDASARSSECDGCSDSELFSSSTNGITHSAVKPLDCLQPRRASPSIGGASPPASTPPAAGASPRNAGFPLVSARLAATVTCARAVPSSASDPASLAREHYPAIPAATACVLSPPDGRASGAAAVSPAIAPVATSSPPPSGRARVAAAVHRIERESQASRASPTQRHSVIASCGEKAVVAGQGVPWTVRSTAALPAPPPVADDAQASGRTSRQHACRSSAASAAAATAAPATSTRAAWMQPAHLASASDDRTQAFVFSAGAERPAALQVEGHRPPHPPSPAPPPQTVPCPAIGACWTPHGFAPPGRSQQSGSACHPTDRAQPTPAEAPSSPLWRAIRPIKTRVDDPPAAAANSSPCRAPAQPVLVVASELLTAAARGPVPFGGSPQAHSLGDGPPRPHSARAAAGGGGKGAAAAAPSTPVSAPAAVAAFSAVASAFARRPAQPPGSAVRGESRRSRLSDGAAARPGLVGARGFHQPACPVDTTSREDSAFAREPALATAGVHNVDHPARRVGCGTASCDAEDAVFRRAAPASGNLDADAVKLRLQSNPSTEHSGVIEAVWHHGALAGGPVVESSRARSPSPFPGESRFGARPARPRDYRVDGGGGHRPTHACCRRTCNPGHANGTTKTAGGLRRAWCDGVDSPAGRSAQAPRCSDERGGATLDLSRRRWAAVAGGRPIGCVGEAAEGGRRAAGGGRVIVESVERRRGGDDATVGCAVGEWVQRLEEALRGGGGDAARLARLQVSAQACAVADPVFGGRRRVATDAEALRGRWRLLLCPSLRCRRDVWRDAGGAATPHAAAKDEGSVMGTIISDQVLRREADVIEATAREHRTWPSFAAVVALLRLDAAPLEGGQLAASPWLDDVVRELYRDLELLLEWRAADAAALRRQGRTETGRVLGLAGDDLVPGGDCDWINALDRADGDSGSVQESETRPSGAEVWLERGALSERMLRLRDAERAYRCACIRAGDGAAAAALQALLGLGRVYAMQGRVRELLDTLTDVLVRTDVHGPWSVHKRVSQQVLASLSLLVASAGMQAVQAELEAGPEQYHPALEHTLEAAFEWGTDGCDA